MNIQDAEEEKLAASVLDVLPPVFRAFCVQHHIPRVNFIAFTLTKAPNCIYRKRYFYKYGLRKQYDIFSTQILRWIKKISKSIKAVVDPHFYCFFEYSRIHHCHGLLYFPGCDYPAWEAELKKLSKFICRISDIRKCYNKTSWLKYMCKDYGRYPYPPIWN